MALPSKIGLRIVTPLQHFEFEVDEVVLPGLEGEFGVLPGHTSWRLEVGVGEATTEFCEETRDTGLVLAVVVSLSPDELGAPP